MDSNRCAYAKFMLTNKYPTTNQLWPDLIHDYSLGTHPKPDRK